MKQTLYIDMDGVCADFDKKIKEYYPQIESTPEEKKHDLVEQICLEHKNIFLELEVIEGAKKNIELLDEIYDIYFLSTPMWNLPESYTDKKDMVGENFGEMAKEKLILSQRKDLLRGRYLIDDRTSNGADNFDGYFLQFGKEEYPDWKAITKFLMEEDMRGYKHKSFGKGDLDFLRSGIILKQRPIDDEAPMSTEGVRERIGSSRQRREAQVREEPQPLSSSWDSISSGQSLNESTLTGVTNDLSNNMGTTTMYSDLYSYVAASPQTIPNIETTVEQAKNNYIKEQIALLQSNDFIITVQDVQNMERDYDRLTKF